MADRVDRRRWMLLTTVGETIFAARRLLVGLHVAGPGGVTALVFLGGCMTAVGIPAYQAMLPDLVAKDDLLAAISSRRPSSTRSTVVGPALAGVVIALGSYTLAFALDAASFFAVIIALLFVRLPPRPPGQRHQRPLGPHQGRARTAGREPGCRIAIFLIGVTAFLLSPFIALVPAVALKLFDNEKTGTAILITAQGIGAVAGALALAPLARRLRAPAGARRQPARAAGVAGAVRRDPHALAGRHRPLRCGRGIHRRPVRADDRRAAPRPAAMRGRVLSLFMVSLGTVYPIGAVVQGALGDQIGLRATTIGCAAVFFVLFAASCSRPPHLVAALDDPVAGDTPVIPPDETSTRPLPSPETSVA